MPRPIKPDHIAMYIENRKRQAIEFNKNKEISEMNKKSLALGRLPAGMMNATEAAYAQKLELEKRAGTIFDYQFEPCSLRLGKNLHYTPDFLVIGFDMVVEFREVKGQWQDDARAKIKMAATKFPWFRFIAIRKKSKKDGGGWDIEVF